jgi:hypothetical protein
LASIFRNAFSGFFTGAVTGNAGTVSAKSAAPESSASTQNSCSVKVFGVCVISTIPGTKN